MQDLIDLLEDDDENTLKDALTEAGCKKVNITKIKKGLKVSPRQTKPSGRGNRSC